MATAAGPASWLRAADVRALWRVLSQHRDLRLVMGAGLISVSGDYVLGIGLAYYVYAQTGSTLASAGMLLATFLPSVLLSSVAGVFVDRWNRKTTMITANLLLAVGLLPLLLVHHPHQVWIVYVVAAWEGVVELFFGPAEQAMLPRLVTDADLVTANALNGQIRQVARLGGSAVGGIVVATGGITALCLADAATFLISAALIARVRTSGAIDVADVDDSSPAAAFGTSRLGAVVREWLDGLRLAGSQPVIRVIMIFTLLAMTGEGLMGTLFVPFVRDILHGSGQEYGVVVAVQAIGGVVGGLVAASLGQRVPATVMFGAGALVFGAVDLAMFLYPLWYAEIWPAVVCMIVVGLPGAVCMAGFTTLLQRSTTDAYRGRVFGAQGAVGGIAIVIGTLTAGFLGESIGIIPVLSFQGVNYMLAGVAILLILRGDASGVARSEAADADAAAPEPGPGPPMELAPSPTQNL